MFPFSRLKGSRNEFGCVSVVVFVVCDPSLCVPGGWRISFVENSPCNIDRGICLCWE